jgi:hypothetical protein
MSCRITNHSEESATMFTIANAVNADKVLKCDWFTECFYDEHCGIVDRAKTITLGVTKSELEAAIVTQINSIVSDLSHFRDSYDVVQFGRNLVDLGEDLATVRALDANTNIIFWGN